VAHPHSRACCATDSLITDHRRAAGLVAAKRQNVTVAWLEQVLVPASHT
jgi:hypothetical protein